MHHYLLLVESQEQHTTEAWKLSLCLYFSRGFLQSEINPEESSKLKLLCSVHLSHQEAAADTVKPVKESRDKQWKSLGRVFLVCYFLREN